MARSTTASATSVGYPRRASAPSSRRRAASGPPAAAEWILLATNASARARSDSSSSWFTAVSAVAAGVSVKVISDQLGHASISFTLERYSHVLPSIQDEAAAKVERMLMG